MRPKKILGQNFLIDRNIQRKIILNCDLNKDDLILEIGPGRGEITQLIAKSNARVYAVEIDEDLCRLLKDKFINFKNVVIIKADILKLNIKRYFSFLPGRLKVIGNIPYYISTPILEHLIKYNDKIDFIFLTLQKEFAKRIVAKPGSKEYGSFSCFIQYYTEPKVIFDIKKTCFYPVPKVDSTFLRLIMKRKRPLDRKQEKKLFKIIRIAFSQRRKMLKNTLREFFPLDKLNTFFEKYNLSYSIRPEDVSIEDFINLIKLA
ncbi:MAG: 16S rRNA (adenine(1518)-N(6)/adenine(1519)-N(6))-dimethyltransferase RsmA [Candidatus Omnitrophica bacterium]|nr:16S rRNA (adenine(1518)-N(6)/adenine(1519)-N(6))-dimethyltransferase RsmA [Candidatus Omnitrophota bacterium]